MSNDKKIDRNLLEIGYRFRSIFNFNPSCELAVIAEQNFRLSTKFL